MSFMDMFKPAPAAAPVAPVAAPVAGAPAPNTGGTTVPATVDTPPGQMPGSNQVPVNPMDSYTKLFDNATTPADKAPVFSLDPKVLGEAANSLNFTQGIPQELMAKATTGDAAAMIEMMNLVARNSYQSAMAHGTALTDRFVSARSEFDLKGIGAKVTQQLTNSALADSPNYQHPVVKAEFTRIANAFQAQNPESSPAEIAKATKEYMQNLHSAMNPDSGKPANAAPAATDWEKWINS